MSIEVRCCIFPTWVPRLVLPEVKYCISQSSSKASSSISYSSSYLVVKQCKKGIFQRMGGGSTEKYDHQHLPVRHHDHHPDHHDNHHGHLVVKQCEEGPSQRVGGGGADRQVGDVALHCTQYKTALLNIILNIIMMEEENCYGCEKRNFKWR